MSNYKPAMTQNRKYKMQFGNYYWICEIVNGVVVLECWVPVNGENENVN
jgi:hypothetical protein